MALERRFAYDAGVVFDAVVEAVEGLEKLRRTDRDSFTIRFGTKMSGFSWGSEWVIQLASDDRGTLASAAMASAGSLVAGMTERKRIDRIWELAEGIIEDDVSKGVVQPASTTSQPEESAADAVARLYGSVLADERFGGQRVRIYSNGFIQIAGWAGGTYHRLLRIEEDFVIQKKTGVGRFAAGVLTMGTNVLVTGNKRGNLYLSFVTDAGTTTLKEDPPTDSGVRRASALALAGRAAIDGASAAQARTSTGSTSPTETFEERLGKAQDLLDKGLISAEEYATTRAQILKEL